MKKNFLLFVAAFAVSASFAQFKKGDKIIEPGIGNFKLASDKYDNGKAKNFSMTVIFGGGYFLSPDFAIGAGLNPYLIFENNFTTTGGNIKTVDYKSGSLSLSFEPYFRYYFKQNKNSRFYGQFAGYFSTFLFSNFTQNNYDATTGTLTSTIKSNDFKVNRIGMTPSVGWSYFFNSHTALNLNLGYSFYKIKNSDKITTTYTNGQPSSTNSGSGSFKANELNWNIGFTIVLPNKKG
ncbi:MAG: outer membrane beta-barrel protein [Daejeonella sp.]